MARTLTDHESIRRWAESHGASPACVRGTGSNRDPGILRLDFEGYTGGDSLAHISWDDWFRKFDENRLALVVDDGGTSNFNKLVKRDGSPRRRRSQSGGATTGPRRTGGGSRSTPEGGGLQAAPPGDRPTQPDEEPSRSRSQRDPDDEEDLIDEDSEEFDEEDDELEDDQNEDEAQH